MSAIDYFLRYKSVNGKSFLAAIKHNKRETQKEFGAPDNINLERTPLNYSLHGLTVAVDIERYSKSLLALAGVSSVRKNAVWAVEVVFSLPDTWHSKNTTDFFQDCYQWTLKTFDGELITFDIHLDEAAPHAHALIFPLIDGKLQGNKIKGGLKELYERYDSFYKEVASKYGFTPPSKKLMSSRDKELLAKNVMKALSNDSIKSSLVYQCIRDSIYSNPVPYAQSLGIPLPTNDENITKSFVDIKRSAGFGSFIR